MQGLGFRVQGLGFKVQGSGFSVQGSGFGVEGVQVSTWVTRYGNGLIVPEGSRVFRGYSPWKRVART